MDIPSAQPANLNFLRQNGFRFHLKRLPHVNYFTQSAVLPGVTLQATEIGYPQAVVPVPGGRLIWEPYDLSFRVDEDMKNYLEILDWLNGLGRPTSSTQIDALVSTTEQKKRGRSIPISSLVSDGTLFIQTNHHNNNLEVTFMDLWPTGITPLRFSVGESTIETIEATVTFRYRYYTVKKMN